MAGPRSSAHPPISNDEDDPGSSSSHEQPVNPTTKSKSKQANPKDYTAQEVTDDMLRNLQTSAGQPSTSNPAPEMSSALKEVMTEKPTNPKNHTDFLKWLKKKGNVEYNELRTAMERDQQKNQENFDRIARNLEAINLRLQPGQQTFPISAEGVAVGARQNLGRHRPATTAAGRNPSPDPRPSSSGDDENYDDQSNPRPFREASHETGLSSHASSSFKLKCEDLGQFIPYYDDPEEAGMVTDGKNIIYTDALCFSEHIKTFLEDEYTYSDAQKQLLAYFPTALGGAAKLW